jgi:hypothetical protein
MQIGRIHVAIGADTWRGQANERPRHRGFAGAAFAA